MRLFLFQFSVIFVPGFCYYALAWLSLEPPYRTFPIDWPVVKDVLENMTFCGLAFAIWSVIWYAVLKGLKTAFDAIIHPSRTKESS